MRRALAALSAAVVGVAVLGLTAGCGDDGRNVRATANTPSSGTAGSGTGSLAEQDLGGPAKDRQVQAAVDSYRGYVVSEVAKLVTATRAFTDAVRAGDVAKAKTLYAPSRVSWEGIEPIAGLVPDIDGAIDSRVDNFAGPEDPKFTGWHRLEYLLWAKNTTAGGTQYADALDATIATLQRGLGKVTITPKAMVLGAGDLVEEVSKGKITGEEDRYSHTDLWDFAANIAGSEAVFRTLTPLLEAKSRALYDAIRHDFEAVRTSLAKYGSLSTTFRSYADLTAHDRSTMQAQLATLSEDLAKVLSALGIA
ncbi:MAG TPA: iron uptake system protein EfeO [Mycobacteriales bacterium]|nr:iron uptake system protein EfeO [Mycobacteriales bacterium]